jgi:hypothetical protein
MSITFATCDRHRALGFMKKLYPNCAVEDTKESAGPVLDFVAADIIRIGDPDFHSGAVFPSKGSPDEIARAVESLRAFHERAMATRVSS